MSNTSLTPEEWNIILRRERAPLMFGTILLFLVGSAGNILLILVYKLKLFPQEGRFFIPYLAISDLTAVSTTTIFLLSLDGTEAVYHSDGACKFFQFLNWSAVQMSILMLFIVAVHRYSLICHPMRPHMTLNSKRVLMASLAGISIIVSVPLLVFSGSVVLQVTFRGKKTRGYFCSFNEGSVYDTGEKVYQGLLFGCNIILLILTTSLYLPIGRVVFRMSGHNTARNNFDDVTTNNTSETSVSDENNAKYTSTARNNEYGERSAVDSAENSHHRRRNIKKRKRSHEIKRKFTISLMLIVVFYVLSYVPFYVITFNRINDLDVWFNLPTATLNGYLFIYRCYMLNNVSNPIIYTMFDVVFRKELVKMLRSFIQQWKCISR